VVVSVLQNYVEFCPELHTDQYVMYGGCLDP
jgi:hypothetical protein